VANIHPQNQISNNCKFSIPAILEYQALAAFDQFVLPASFFCRREKLGGMLILAVAPYFASNG
jgi:hypothetical protein